LAQHAAGAKTWPEVKQAGGAADNSSNLNLPPEAERKECQSAAKLPKIVIRAMNRYRRIEDPHSETPATSIIPKTDWKEDQGAEPRSGSLRMRTNGRPIKPHRLQEDVWIGQLSPANGVRKDASSEDGRRFW
jgi:hypothetical protein